jgi:hypothetical protein
VPLSHLVSGIHNTYHGVHGMDPPAPYYHTEVRSEDTKGYRGYRHPLLPTEEPAGLMKFMKIKLMMA